MANNSNQNQTNPTKSDGGSQLQEVVNRLNKTMQRDALIQKTTNDLRNYLQADRVVIYYFYRQWEGQVTYESLSPESLSIYGSTGPDECFNNEYALMYEMGRVRAIPDIEVEAINPCHRDFLRTLGIRANLVVPILNSRRLWGLLIAHHCQDARSWSESDIKMMQKGAIALAKSPAIQNS